jgi:hypothetical protein
MIGRCAVVAVAAAGLGLGLAGPAGAAEADPEASCAGLAAASRAGTPGAEADVVLGVIAESFPPGLVNFSDFASFHEGSADACLA